MLAAPISNSLGEYIIWFRPEQVRTVTWGGDPLKPVVVGDDPTMLSPRRSFAQWHQVVEGTSEPWSVADLTTARLIGETVADVVLQFRSVRMLIAQDQLEQVSQQVRMSELPVIIADAAGKILLTNEAFVRLLKSRAHAARTTRRSARPCSPSPTRCGGDCTSSSRSCGPGARRFAFMVSREETKPLLVRADPIFSSPRRALGFVVLFTDLTDRKAVEAARRKFQEGIIDRQRITTVRLDSKADLAFQNLLSPIIENAQLAALEITDGVDMARMPAMLESVKASVTRSAELLGAVDLACHPLA